MNFFVLSLYTEIKCDRKLAALGASMPEVDKTMIREGSEAIWQSMQLDLITWAGTDSSCGVFLCSPLWHGWQRDENNAVLPLSFL